MGSAFGLIVVALAVGCSGGGRDRATGDTSLVPTVTPDPSPDSDYFEPKQIYLNGEIAYNGVRQLTADVDGNAAPPMIYFTLATGDWDGTSADIANFCLIGIPLVQAEDRPDELLNQSQDLWFAYSWSPERDPVLSTCNTEGYEMDPSFWGNDPVGLFVDGVDHFLAVGQMTRETFEVVYAQAPDLDLVGGAFGLPYFFQVNGNAPGRIDEVYGFPFATDASGRLLIESGGLVEIPTADLIADPTIPAFYAMSSLVYWQL